MKPALLALLCLGLPAAADDTAWPPLTREAKPWTRWWWLGSGVDTSNLTKQLEAFSKAGIGGVEICPIYGAKGFESRDLSFLSEPWTNAYAHTAKEAERLDMGVDLTTGTGWPFGGPWVKEEDASASVDSVIAKAEGGQPFSLKLPKGRVEVLSAWPAQGDPMDLMSMVKDGALAWTPPAGSWRIHGLISRHAIQKVKRSAPGGAGCVLDPYSTKAIDAYLKPFSEALDRPNVPEPRAHFHDSFEYYGAEWTDDFFTRFQQLRGYDLRTQLQAFHGEGESDTIARVRADYRETMSDLHREYLARWHDWAKARGSLTRNQAHGSPGNLLDHYAVADIPETEIFRHVDEAQIPMLQFASSAAHVTGKRLASAETFTWLGEHFQVTPQQLKEAADFVWLGGVNHIFFHGIPYSPEDAAWPGWLFYASTNMGPNGGLWRDLPAFTRYLGRCQTMLQSGKPDSEVLVYFPMADLWHDGSKGLPLFTVHNQEKWLHTSAFYREAMALWNHGIPCDFVSDLQLNDAKAADQRIQMGGNSYKALVVPELRYLPVATAKHLLDLAAQGAPVIFRGGVPTEVPGLNKVQEGREELAKLFKEHPVAADTGLPAEIRGESMAEHDLRFVRRRHEDGWSYFIVNRSDKSIDEKINFATPMKSAVLFDPMRGASGVVATDGGVRLVLAAGESRILRTYRDKTASGTPWLSNDAGSPAVALNGTWKVSFLDGGPELPPAYETSTLASWTEREGASYQNFSGTALYRLEFDWQGKSPALLSLGHLCETAKIRLNGKNAGTAWISEPVRVEPKQGNNVLEVEVTNLAANRIADLDRRKVPWKAFHEINFVNVDYKPFDASVWKPLPSGLLGPVTLTPLR
ncbi:glycosyl hydrolase [Haloferula sp. BvORR071]|uniref:glycosyl hydrolase n=1 Tax=Haloferula sp. BvORR071 TaxID=1396141 RepID=UPI00055485AD|nr:glycosyl hydrolase [Haloferula sp. BvORR071]